MKLKPLDRLIKSAYRRCCAFCHSPLTSDAISKSGRRRRVTVNTRVFTCTNCKASFCYERDGNHFRIHNFSYTLENYTLECICYGTDAGHKVIYDPEPDKSWIDNEIIAQSPVKITFPSTKEKIEDRIYMYITFS